jgi:hypothetical protein
VWCVGVGRWGHTLVGRGTPCCSCWWCCSYFCSISSSCLFARVIGPLISAAACCSPAYHSESKRGTRACCLSRRVTRVCECVVRTCCSCFRLRVIIPAGAAGAAPGVGLAAAFSPYVHPTGASLNTNAFLVVRRWSENCVLACVWCCAGQDRALGAAC